MKTKKEYQEALNTIKFMCIGEASTEFDFDTGLPLPREVYIEDYFVEECKLLQELVDKNERLVAHVRLTIKMLEENSPYAIETLKEVIEKDWSEDENNQSN